MTGQGARFKDRWTRHYGGLWDSHASTRLVFFFLRNTFRALALSFSNVTLHKDEVQTVRKGADGAD